MRLSNTLFSLLVLWTMSSASAHSIDCARFYSRANDFEKDLIELKSSFYPLTTAKQEYLERLHYSVITLGKESDKALLYNDSDYKQFDTVKSIERLLERTEGFKKKNSWTSDRALLVSAANGDYQTNKNKWGNNSYENLGSYIEASNAVALFVNDFTSNSSEWRQTKRVIPPERIQWFEMRAVSFIYIYTSIAICHTQFLSAETRDAQWKNLKK